MYKFRVVAEAGSTLLEVTLEGMFGLDEARRAGAELKLLITRNRGKSIRILADVRKLFPLSPEVADEFRAVQAFGAAHGVERVAQIVESSVVMLQRSRISRESGTDTRTRTFRDRDEALLWLSSGEPS